MVSQNSEFTRKLRAAVRAKIQEYGIDVDDELPDYVMIMVGNKKDKMRMKTDLKLFLGQKTTDFVEWLFGFFQKMKTGELTTPTPTSSLILQTTTSMKDENNRKESEEKMKKTLSEKEIAKSKTEERSREKPDDSIYSNKKMNNKEEDKSIKRNRSESKSSVRDRSRSPIHPRKKVPAEYRDNKKKNTTVSHQITKSTTFAVPRPILRSVVVHPQPSNHPRIRARTPSPEMYSPEPDEHQHVSSPLMLNMEETTEEKPEEIIVEEKKSPKRKVVASNSLLFQRALIQTSQSTIISKNSEKKEAIEPKKDQEEEIKDQTITKKDAVDEGKDSQQQPQQQQPQQRFKITTGRQQHAIVGIGAIFQRAIHETKKQNEGGGNIVPKLILERKNTAKRLYDNTMEGNHENEEGLGKKKFCIECKTDEEMAQDEAKDDQFLLFVNLEKPAKRSIRKEPKKTKSGLTLLKEHIGVVDDGRDAEKQPVESKPKRNKDEDEKEEEAVKTREHAEIQASSNGERKIEQKINLSAKKSSEIISASAAAVSLWNGRIEIDDMSSTDDEAEIDAVLEEQHKLRKLALERESEIKGRELPPTAALTRPLLYNDMSESLLSPSDADLLPATFHQQNSPIISLQQQSTSKQQAQIVARPYATVAPCLTIPTVTAPATMIVHQQYQCHQQQQLSISPSLQQFSHPYSISNSSIGNQPLQVTYKTKGSFSKIYSTISPSPNQLFSSVGIGYQAEKAQSGKSISDLKQKFRQMTQQYTTLLEDQKLLLAQIQKMSSNQNAEQKKTLLFRCKQMAKMAEQMKTQLAALNAQIMANNKQQNGNELKPDNNGLVIKRFY